MCVYCISLSVCLYVCLSKSLHAFVFLSLYLSFSHSHSIWCSPSRPGSRARYRAFQVFCWDSKSVPFPINLSWWKPIIMVLSYALFINYPHPSLPHEYKWDWCLSDFPVLWYMPHSITRGYYCIGLSPFLAQLHVCITFFYTDKGQSHIRIKSETCWSIPVRGISYADSSKAVQICWPFFKFINICFMLSSHGDLCKKPDLYLVLWSVVVCVREGAMKALLVWYWPDVGLPCLNIRSHSRRLAMMRLRSYLCAPNRI